VPKLFGYTDKDLFKLTQGVLKNWTSGVEYYFGLHLSPIEKKPQDFPQQLVKNKLIKVIHAPFVKENYPIADKKTFFNYLSDISFWSYSNPNPWQRLPQAIKLAKTIRAKKLNAHAVELVLAKKSDQLFKKLNKLSKKHNIKLCLENNARSLKARKKDQKKWAMAHNPINLINYLEKNNLNNILINIDTAHLAASEYNVPIEWQKIKKKLGKNLNRFIGHFHLVDYDIQHKFQAACLGKGSLGIKFFQQLIDDLYQLNYQGTISIEAAPEFLHQHKIKCLHKAFWRRLNPWPKKLKHEEQYLLKMIKKIYDHSN